METITNTLDAYELLRNFIRQGDALSLKEELLKLDDCIEGRDDNGNTLLLQAAFLGRSECLKLLLEIGQSDYQTINVFGQNALTLATHAGCMDCIKLLLSKWSYKDYTETSVVPPLCVAAMRGHFEIVDFYCQLTPHPTLIQSAHGISPLTLARRKSHTAVAERLFEAVCSPLTVTKLHEDTAVAERLDDEVLSKLNQNKNRKRKNCSVLRFKPYLK